MLAVVLLLSGGVFAYNSLQVELFPEIEFPLVAVTTSYPAVDPEGVVQDVTTPIERAISSTDGLETVRSTSIEGSSIVLATFRFGTDMANAESVIQTAINGLAFPDGVEDPVVGRFDPDQFPVMQISVTSDDGVQAVSPFVRSRVVPALEEIAGVMRVQTAGDMERQIRVSVDPERLAANGISLAQVGAALSDNNLTLPAGLVFGGGRSLPVKTTHTLASVDDIRRLVVGSSAEEPVTLADVAAVVLTDAMPTSISRANGKPAVSISIVKEAEANTIEVTDAVRFALDDLAPPPGVEVVVVDDQGPAIQRQIDTLLSEAFYGFLFAVSVVFVFMMTLRPTAIRGLLSTLRPTVVIALAIPLSVLTGVLLMAWQDMSLNFMSLGGLAISVGRVVDDAIVVLENVYRHIQAGRERWRAALDATVEVGPAIFASTLTTIVVFIPLGFIEGLVGAFFLPFALTVSFALIASLAVALTAVPVLGAYLLRPGDLPMEVDEDEIGFLNETWMQRAYTPVLRWSLGHKAVTLIGAGLITGASLILLTLIPVTLFPSSGERFIEIDLGLPPGTPPNVTLAEVIEIEGRAKDFSDIYTSTVGATNVTRRIGAPGSFNKASMLLVLNEDAPEDLANTLRRELEKPGLSLNIREIAQGPPTSGVEIAVSGPSYDDVTVVAEELMASLVDVEGVVNLTSDVTEARDELSVQVDPEAAGGIGLDTRQVGFQLSQYLVGRVVTTIDVDGEATDVVLSASREALGGANGLGSLVISGPGGTAPLGELAEVSIQRGPVTIIRTDGERSASITGDITATDTQAIGAEIDSLIESLSLPPGVTVVSGGIFADIAEGFQAIFLSMAVGIALMYLVMVGSLGSLRNPVVIVSSLPLALIGVLVSLAVTGRTLGLPAMMGTLLLIGIVVTNAIVLIAFVEQLRAAGMSATEALVTGGRVRLRPILMTALTTSFALLPLAAFSGSEGGIISAELATVVIGGLISSTGLTLIVVPVVYYLFNVSIPDLLHRALRLSSPSSQPEPEPAAD